MKDFSVKKFIASEKENSKTTRAASKKIDVDLAYQELNDLDYEFTEFKIKNNELVEEKSNPVADMRKGIATSLKNAGVIDSADVDKVVNDTELNKATAEGFAAAAKMHVRDYISTGRYYQIEPADKKSARTVLFSKTIDKKDVETSKIVKNADDSYSSVPTGDTVRTDKHQEIGVRNKVGSHLKYKLDKSKK